ncbi:AAA-like domain-containing protein [Leptothoe kymatousa]|uniref:AAA-like domain-containing protein n=1 Tax=Leptothoe kymatousa TAU-MAC 1615 TaxID=2364775 RepID=A0ABS5Y4C5_9CYAN|nr:AAA-like domain-containing protein [Leptothoe kymatousa]MBT9312209.1 AAA-like domain-containing protein [Leptothoe kymatousa TAU-MAC 1615]
MQNFQHKSQRRRKRGVLLTHEGLERFQTAKLDSEYIDNCGQRYTLEDLRERTGVSTDTLTKVLAGDCRVDKQTLRYCFKAFGLDLNSTDYYIPELTDKSHVIRAQTHMTPYDIAGGPLSVTSPLYVERPRTEKAIYQALEQPGTLIRIKGASRSGKTSMIARIAHESMARGYHPISISFQLAEKKILNDLDKLLQWFCASVSLAMGATPTLDNYWNTLFGSKLSCKIYFEQYLLPMTQRPIVLLLDDVDRLYQHPDVADEFLYFLRNCYEEAKTTEIWQLMRFVTSQTFESYVPLHGINKPPFNIGIEIVGSPKRVRMHCNGG